MVVHAHPSIVNSSRLLRDDLQNPLQNMESIVEVVG
jgi:hypothetical protein